MLLEALVPWEHPALGLLQLASWLRANPTFRDEAPVAAL